MLEHSWEKLMTTMRTIHASHVSGEIQSAFVGRAKSAIWQLGQGLKLNRQIADLAKCKSLGDVVALSAQFYTLTLPTSKTAHNSIVIKNLHDKIISQFH